MPALPGCLQTIGNALENAWHDPGFENIIASGLV